MMMDKIEIRSTTADDMADIVRVEREAFLSDAEARLAVDLLGDPSAEPRVSLLALCDGKAIGHILFTRVAVEGCRELSHILAPLAVVPCCQREGVGGMLISAGLDVLRQMGSLAVFVLGHKEYYPRHGFLVDAKMRGYETPYPIAEHHAECWMVQQLTERAIAGGRVLCAATLNKPECW